MNPPVSEHATITFVIFSISPTVFCILAIISIRTKKDVDSNLTVNKCRTRFVMVWVFV